MTNAPIYGPLTGVAGNILLQLTSTRPSSYARADGRNEKPIAYSLLYNFWEVEDRSNSMMIPLYPTNLAETNGYENNDTNWNQSTTPKSQSVTACMRITRSLGLSHPKKGRVAGKIQWDQCPQATFYYKYFYPSLISSSIVMVSTGMKPAPVGSASRMQRHGNESATDDGNCTIPRPTPAEFRKLVSGSQENIIRAMDVSQPVFEDFKKILRDQAVMVLDCERFLHEQVPDIWVVYLDWAREELASFLSKYTDAWPVELYIEHYLSKKTYAKRHAFRAKMTRLRPALKPIRAKSSASERGMSLPPAPDGPPPPYERHVFVQPNDATGGDDLTVENFLKTVNPDLSHFSPAFEELGISSEADLVVVRSWAPAVRKDFFERELMGRMSALQIQALNVKLGET